MKRSHAGHEMGGEGQNAATQRDAAKDRNRKGNAMRRVARNRNETESQMVRLLSWFGSQESSSVEC